jgi:negative regulator of flagellin synthesis FlgM
MIDGIGKGPSRLELVRGSTARGASVGRVGERASGPNGSGPASPVAEMASAGAPVDTDKVAAIRAAIAGGRYPVDPDKIAASMLALDLPFSDGQ